MKPEEVEQYKGFTIQISRDEDPQNPRDNDNCTKMICLHRRYRLGDSHNYTETVGLSLRLIDDFNPLLMKPLYLYDHGGLSIQTKAFSDGWDSGQVGFVLVNLEQCLKMGFKAVDLTPARLEQIIDAEVAEYDNFLQGNVWGYEILNIDGEVIEDCWGFNGEIKDVMAEAKSLVNNLDPALAKTKYGTFIRLECGKEDRVSKEYGPFPFTQLTYDSLRVGPDGTHVADISRDGIWLIGGTIFTDEDFAQTWTDVVIFDRQRGKK